MGSTGLHRLLAGLGLATLTWGAAVAAERLTDDFSAGWDRWQPLQAANWELRRDGDNPYLALVKPGVVPPTPERPGVRRPAEFVLLKDRRWREVTLTAKVQSLRPTTLKGRDVVLLFGWQDDGHGYYVHLSNDSNGGTHNVIVRVDGTTRKAIQQPPKPAPCLTDGWHTARVSLSAEGAIKVFFDNLEEPLMTAQDTTYRDGMVGLGAFDDPAAFDDVVVEGTPTP